MNKEICTESGSPLPLAARRGSGVSRLRCAAASAGLVFGLGGGALAQSYSYSIAPLGTLVGTHRSWGLSVSDNGQVAGRTETNTGAGYQWHHAFRWSDANGNGRSDPGEMKDLGTLGGGKSSAYGINEAGRVVGEAQIKSGSYRAFLHDGVKMIDLTGKNGSAAVDVNNNNRVVGVLSGRAFTWSGGRWSYLPALTSPTGSSTVVGLNDSDVVAGTSANAVGQDRAVIWQNGAVSALPLPPEYASSAAEGINNAGVVAGRVAGSSGTKPALWENGGWSCFRSERTRLWGKPTTRGALWVSAARATFFAAWMSRPRRTSW